MESHCWATAVIVQWQWSEGWMGGGQVTGVWRDCPWRKFLCAKWHPRHELHFRTRLIASRHPGCLCLLTCSETLICDWGHQSAHTTWISRNLWFHYSLFHEKRLRMMLWNHDARVNSHQRWKQTQFRVCFHLWCELTSTMNVTEWQVSWNSW